ncbi:MAG: hypothetical protein EAX81_08555 [Candidatus Thorarchaeota archaeon]|nr:hypothetical protein [Candidatus Thorarchaeota archaeon]
MASSQVTEKNREYWDSKAKKHIAEVNRLFQFMTKEEVDRLYSISRKLLEDTTGTYEEMR